MQYYRFQQAIIINRTILVCSMHLHILYKYIHIYVDDGTYKTIIDCLELNDSCRLDDDIQHSRSACLISHPPSSLLCSLEWKWVDGVPFFFIISLRHMFMYWTSLLNLSFTSIVSCANSMLKKRKRERIDQIHITSATARA